MSTASLIPGRRREQLTIAGGAAGAILLLMLIVACVIVTWQNDAPAVRVGTVDQFPPGTARMINFDATLPDKTRVLIARSSHFANVTSPLPLYIAHTRNDEWYAIYPRDPKSGCSIAWFDSNSYFIDPCYGSTYTITGA